MIVVDIKMWPKGDETKAYPLGRMFIWNKGSGTAKKADYGFAVRRKGKLDICDNLPVELQGGNTHVGTVEGHRRNDLVIWVLIMKCLKKIYDKEG